MKYTYIFLMPFIFLLLFCAKPKEFSVLIKMMPIQEEKFKNEIVKKFEIENNCKINVITFENNYEITNMLKSGDSIPIGLVKTPFEVTKTLVDNNQIIPISQIADYESMEKFRNDYFLLNLTTYDKEPYYFPRKFETRLMIYIKSKVKEAVSHWTDFKDSLNTVLKRANGFGLPYAYELESDPNLWDFYDVYVAGYYWSQRDYGDGKKGRVAHRSKKYSGTSQRLIDRAFQINGGSGGLSNFTGEVLTDVFEWEAHYAKDGIYSKRMLLEGWSGSDIYKGFKTEDVYLAFMTQIDCFFIHGRDSKELPGYLSNPNELGFALMPKGVSFQLTPTGKYIRVGTKAVTTGGWWWGIPKSSPHPELSFRFAQFITNTDNQIDGCSHYGMIPVRKDILGDISLMFGRGWVSDLFKTSFAQLVYNGFNTVPPTSNIEAYSNALIEAWYSACVDGPSLGKNITREKIKRLLKEHAVSLGS